MMLIAQLRKPHTHYSCNSQSLAPLVQTLVVIIFVSNIGYGLLCGNRTRCLLINLVLWDRHELFLWVAASVVSCHASITCDFFFAQAIPVGLVTNRTG